MQKYYTAAGSYSMVRPNGDHHAFYDACDVDAALEAGRVAMRDLWRLEPGTLPSDELALRCKAFIGGG